VLLFVTKSFPVNSIPCPLSIYYTHKCGFQASPQRVMWPYCGLKLVIPGLHQSLLLANWYEGISVLLKDGTLPSPHSWLKKSVWWDYFKASLCWRNLLTRRIGEILWCPLLQSISTAQDCLNLTVNFLSSSAVKFWESFRAFDTTGLWLFTWRSMVTWIWSV
jgi:hypothetical protein